MSTAFNMSMSSTHRVRSSTAPVASLALSLLLLVLLPAPAAAGDSSDEQQGVFDTARGTVRSSAEWLARSVDNWFGDRPFEQGGKVADGHVDLNVLHRRDEGNDINLRFNARMRLPNLEEHTHFFLGRDNEHELVADTPAAFTRQERLLPGQRSEQTVFAGLGYNWRENVELRLGLRSSLKPYVQARLRRRWAVEPRGWVGFTETLFWSLNDRLGATTALSYEHGYSPSLALRWMGAATVTQESRQFDWSSSLGLVKNSGAGRFAAVELIADGLSGSSVPVHEWGLRARWQQPLHRPWLHGELILGHFWARSDGAAPRQGLWAFGLGMSMWF